MHRQTHATIDNVNSISVNIETKARGRRYEAKTKRNKRKKKEPNKRKRKTKFKSKRKQAIVICLCFSTGVLFIYSEIVWFSDITETHAWFLWLFLLFLFERIYEKHLVVMLLLLCAISSMKCFLIAKFTAVHCFVHIISCVYSFHGRTHFSS